MGIIVATLGSQAVFHSGLTGALYFLSTSSLYIRNDRPNGYVRLNSDSTAERSVATAVSFMHHWWSQRNQHKKSSILVEEMIKPITELSF